MQELVFGLFCLSIVSIGLIAFGAVLGQLVFRSRIPPSAPAPDRESDLRATARTLRRLSDEGSVDDETRTKMFAALLASQRAGESARTASTAPASRERARPAGDFDPFAPPPIETTANPSQAPEFTSPTSDSEGIRFLEPVAEPTPAEPIAEPILAAEPVLNAEPVHPLDKPEPIVPPAPSRPQQRRRALADVLQAFLEEKNIRWGELVSGVLIVGCSVALAISLRREIASLSDRFIYLPALLFMLATAAIHGAGNYTLRRWKLRATSRGTLIIATLLIPINFLAAIIVTGPESRQLPPLHPLYLSAVAVGLVAFGAMAYFAGIALMRGGSWRLWIAVMGTSVGQLIVSRLAEESSTALSLAAVVAVPSVAFLVATVGQLRVAVRRPRIGLTTAYETLLVLGVASFALAVPIGLVLSKSASVGTTLSQLSTPLSLPSLVVLATGLALFRCASSKRQALLRTVGVSLALLGGASMLAATAAAWPDPELLIAVGLFGFASLSALAAVGRLPALHVPAIACGALACLVGFHWLQGSFDGYAANLSRRAVDLFLMGRSGVVLAALATVVGGGAGALFVRGRHAAGRCYLAACGGLALLSVAIALAVGFWRGSPHEPDLATPVLLYFAAAASIASWFIPRRSLTWIGSTLALVGFVHALGWNAAVQGWLDAASLAPDRPVLAATLLHGLVAMAAASLLAIREAPPSLAAPSRRRRELVIPLVASAAVSSVLALPFAAVVLDQRFGEHAWYLAAISLTWLGVAFVLRSRIGFAIFQALATATLVLTTASICQQQSWWDERLLDPRHLQAQFGALAFWCLAWSVGRRLLRSRFPGVVGLTRWSGISVDEVVLELVPLGLLAMAVAGALPGIAIEAGMAEATVFAGLPPWKSVFELGGWIATALTFIAVVGSLCERFSLRTFSALFLIGATAATLMGGAAHESLAVASALRWSFAGLAILLTTAICLGPRIERARRRLRWIEWSDLPADVSRLARGWTLVLCSIPILGLTTLSLVQAAGGVAPRGPLAESFFGRIGAELSYGVPMALLVAAFVAFAIRDRQPRLALAGSFVFQYLVNLGYFLPILQNPETTWDWSIVIGCLQWNSLGLAAYAIAWLGTRRWIDARDRDVRLAPFDPYLAAQVIAAVSAAAVTTGLASAAVVGSPHDLTPFAALGAWPTYVLCLLGFGAAAWLTRHRLETYGVSLLFGFACALSGPLAVTFEGSPGGWRAFHLLSLAWLAVAFAATTLAWIPPRKPSSERRVATSITWATALLALSFALALRGAPFDPQRPWWAFGALLAVTVAATALGFRTRRQVYAYASALTAAAASTIVWWGAWPTDGMQGVVELVQLDLIAVVTIAIVWLIAEVWYRARFGQVLDRSAFEPTMQRAAAIAAIVILFDVVGIGFVATGLVGMSREHLNVAGLVGWISLATLGALLIGSLWDRKAKLVLPALYAWALTAMLMSLDVADAWFEYDGPTVFVVVGFLTTAYVALAGHLWSNGASLAAFGERVRIPDTLSGLQRTATWLPTVTLLLAAMTILVDFAVVLTFGERWMRVTAACGPALLAYGVGCQAQQDRRVAFQYVSLILVSFAAVLVAWADLDPGWRETLVLERAVRFLLVFAALTIVYAIPISRWTETRGSDWFSVVRRMATLCGGASLISLGVVLALEAAFFEPGVGAPFGHPYQVVAVAIVLVGLIVAFLAMALSARLDRFALSGDARQRYVYAAEFVGAALFAHLYMSYPQMFGALRPYWPYIAMAIAFVGVGAGEILRRAGVRVLAEPLQRTGGLLPLLPALGWWLNPALGIDGAGHYSLLLFFAGLTYATLGMMRRSYVWGIAATIAGNAALWAMLADYEPLSLFKHPQTWLIPPAVSTLVAAQLLRRQLSDAQLTAIRYLCLTVIYVSSTADIFIGGVGHNLWEPMALATLSVIGVFVGIGLQIRAFLYLGATFVFLSVVSMVWHAYANIGHVGIWWAFGILLGVSILAIFGIFEKKRAELTRLVHGMRTWEP